MRRVEATPQQIADFAAALDKQLIGERQTNDWLAAQIAQQLGGEPTTDEAVRLWRNGKREMPRRSVFAAERVFGLNPGALSRLLGYLPLEAAPSKTVIEAIGDDAQLDRKSRERLVLLYLSEREG